MWRKEKRKEGFRIWGEGKKGIRIEWRIGGEDINKYMEFEEIIEEGMKGVDEKMEMEENFVGDEYREVRMKEIN